LTVPLSDRGDGELAAMIARGDERAFMAVYDAHAPLLYGVVVRVLGDPDAAADVIQEVFVTLWQRAAGYEADLGSLRTWLARIARNRALDRVRSLRRAPRLVRAQPSGADGTLGSGPDPDPASSDDGPGEHVERRWVQAVVRAALAEMPEEERSVLRLAYAAGLSQTEIAAQLALPLGTVKSRTRRGMARLRTILGAVPDLGAAGRAWGSDADARPESGAHPDEEVRRGTR
jgi:RNA polymerase sigma-70 factor (ECF subfamily)